MNIYTIVRIPDDTVAADRNVVVVVGAETPDMVAADAAASLYWALVE